jgi:hypothetical protein
VALPFTAEEFFQVFIRYNLSIWPLQILAYALGVLAVGLAFRRSSYSDMTVSAVLAFLWFWMGIGYHLLFFSAINPAAYLFGALFIVEGLLLQWVGVLQKGLSFRFRLAPRPLVGALLVLYAMFIYPLIGSLLGHGYPRSPGFGVAPCPTTIFTFGLLLWTEGRVPRRLLVIPALWAVIGSFAAFGLGVREDFALLPAAIVAVVLLLRKGDGRQ